MNIENIIDIYSLHHFITLLVIGKYLPGNAWFIVFAGAYWEILEYTFCQKCGCTWYFCEPIINRFGDILINVMGYQVGQTLLAKQKID